MTTYLFILAFFPVAYRLRGSGLIGNFKGYLAWSATVWVGVFMLTVNPLAASLSALGAFAGKWIGHSKFYQVRTRTQFAAMTLIHGTRYALLAMPVFHEAAYVFYPAIAVGVVCAATNAITCRLMDTRCIDDMLRYAEPVIGLAVATGLVVTHISLG